MPDFIIRSITPADRPWILPLLDEWWGGPEMVSRGKLFRVDELPGLVAEKEGRPVGLATYRIDAGECELTSFNSLEENIGIGSALLERVAETARISGCRRLWLITTNDNTNALRFYQKKGMTISAIYVNAIEASRKLKPGIPVFGNDGIPIRDEIELEMHL